MKARPDDTAMGGTQAVFPSTLWSDILTAADPSARAAQAKLESLCRSYWRPVYAYVRTAWKKPVEDAKDLTQAFFAHLLEKRYLARLRPELGSFRGYLKRALKNFLLNVKRGEEVRRPIHAAIALDAAPEALAALGPAAPEDSPEEAYDRVWFRDLFLSAIDDLKEALERDGKPAYFQAFHAYCLDAAAPAGAGLTPTYREVAQRVGVKESDVRNYLTHCRRLLERLLRERIRDYVPADADVAAELAQVLQRGPGSRRGGRR